jgi:hypothetical protein
MSNPEFDFFRPGYRVDKIPVRIKEFKYLTKKADTKFSKIRSRMNIPDPGTGFFSILDPGSRCRIQGSKKHRILDLDFFPCRIPDSDPGIKKAPAPESGSATLENPRPVPGEIRRAHFLRTHDMSEISAGLATVPVGVPRRFRRWGGENRLFCR